MKVSLVEGDCFLSLRRGLSWEDLALPDWQGPQMLEHQENNKTQLSPVTQSCLTLCDPKTAAHQASLSITNTRSLLKLMSIELVVPFNHLILYCPLLLPSLIIPSIRPCPMSQFCTSGGQSIGASASASFLPTEYSGLLSFRMDWLNLLAVRGTLKSLLQHHNRVK